MSSTQGPHRDAPSRPVPDAGHLDEDPEAIEDPVHAGDARHQHEHHEHEHDAHEHPAPEPGSGRD